MASDLVSPPSNIITWSVSLVQWSAATAQPCISHSIVVRFHWKMQGHKSTPKLRTHSSISNSSDVARSSSLRQSTSAERDNRLLVLHRKCPNPLVCLRSTASNSPPLLPVSVPVPLFQCSPILCQSLPCKPRLRPVTSLQEAAEIQVTGSAMNDSCTDVPAPSSLSARRRHLRRKVYSRASAEGAGQRKQSIGKSELADKGQVNNIYIPTASCFIPVNPPLESRRLEDNTNTDATGIQQNTYKVDVEQQGQLKIEHVENPRPLPPRNFVGDNNNEVSVRPKSPVHDRPLSVCNRRCSADSRLRPAGNLVIEQPADIACSDSDDQRFSLSPLISPLQRVCSESSDRTVFRVSSRLKQTPNNIVNSRSTCVGDVVSQRCSSGQHALQSADKFTKRNASLRKAISDVSRQLSRSNPVFLPCDDSSECTDSCSNRG